MTAPVRSISDAQRVKIFAAARELALSEHELHELATSTTGKTSLRALSMEEATRVIDLLVRRGASSGTRRRLPADVPRLVTPWQLERIGELIKALGLQDARPAWEGVVKRAIGRTWPRTSAEAAKVIEAFKAIQRRRFGENEPREEHGQ